MTVDAFLFWFLAFVTLASGLTVILASNPVYSALSLAMTMVGIAALFVSLDAVFIAGVQLIVYAGAVMVLFVMVLMLFDLKKELSAFSRGPVSGVLKIISVGMLAGLLLGAINVTTSLFGSAPKEASGIASEGMETTRAIGHLLFSRYVFGFEALGILLLVIAVGAVALSRSKGGTHEH